MADSMRESIPFSPNKEAYSPDTNAGHVFSEMLSDPSMPWFTQMDESLQMSTKCARGMFVLEYLPDDLAATIASAQEAVMALARRVAGTCKKEFDARIVVNKKETKTVYVDVPRTIKTGLFKTETVVEKEARAQEVITRETMLFRGWLLEHFERVEAEYTGEYRAWYNWDYCLGNDGKLYMITSWGEERRGNPREGGHCVYECVFFSPRNMTDRNQNIFVSVNSGFIGSLDVIPAGTPDQSRAVTIDDNGERYEFNFPLQINDVLSFPYGFAGGVTDRLNKLLEAEGPKQSASDEQVPNSMAEIIEQVQYGAQVAENGDTRRGLGIVERAYRRLKEEFGLDPENANIACWIVENHMTIGTPNKELVEMCESFLEDFGNSSHLLQNLLGRYQFFMAQDIYKSLLDTLDVTLIDAFLDCRNRALQNLAYFEDGLSQDMVRKTQDALKGQTKFVNKIAAFDAGRDYFDPETGEKDSYLLTLNQIDLIAENPGKFPEHYVSGAQEHIFRRQMLGDKVTDADVIRLRIRLKPYLPYYKQHPELLPMEIAELERSLRAVENR